MVYHIERTNDCTAAELQKQDHTVSYLHLCLSTLKPACKPYKTSLLAYLHLLSALAMLIALAALPGAQVALHAVAALPLSVQHDVAQGGSRLGILTGTPLQDGGGGVLSTRVWRGRADAALCIWLPHTVLHKITDL